VADTVIHALGKKFYLKTQYSPQRHHNITGMEGCVSGCQEDGGNKDNVWNRSLHWADVLCPSKKMTATYPYKPSSNLLLLYFI